MFKIHNLVKPYNSNLNSLITKSNDNLYTLYIYNDNFYFFIKCSGSSITCNPVSLSTYISKPANITQFINRDLNNTHLSVCFNKLNSILFS